MLSPIFHYRLQNFPFSLVNFFAPLFPHTFPLFVFLANVSCIFFPLAHIPVVLKVAVTFSWFSHPLLTYPRPLPGYV